MFGLAGKAFVLLTGALVLLNGVVNIFHNVLQKWCVATSTQSCVGPALKWNTGATGFLTDSNADGYRTVVTTDLNTVLDIWLPIVLGCLILSSASPSMRSSNLFTATIAYSWPKMATCLFLTGLFGAFGYNGNFGILTGLLCSFSAIWCGLVHVLALHDGKFPCANQDADKSGTPFFDRVFKKKSESAPSKPAKAASTKGPSAKGPSTKSPITGKDAYTTTTQFHARYR